MPGCIGLHCGTTINLAQQYSVICMLNAGNMHMRKGSTGSESNTLLKPFCRVNLAAAAVTSNKLRLHANAQSPVCTCLSGQPHSLHCCGICQAVQMYCCAKNFLGLRNIATTRNSAAIRNCSGSRTTTTQLELENRRSKMPFGYHNQGASRALQHRLCFMTRRCFTLVLMRSEGD